MIYQILWEGPDRTANPNEADKKGAMKFFIDTANLDQIREAQDLGVLDGVTTNPSLMAKEGILSRNKEGLFVYYAIQDTTIQGLCLLVSGRIRQELEQEQRRLKSIS